MESTELLQRVKQIEIKTRQLSRELFSGKYHSAFKGRGVSFEKVREYEPGDEVRFIDWKVTAKLGHPYVKVFNEERELTIMLMIDVSASSDFGTHGMLKRDMITEMAAVLAFSASSNQDKIGLIFYSDRVEKFIPPQKGRSHALRLIREMVNLQPERKGTNLRSAFSFLSQVVKKKCVVFLISDFIDPSVEPIIKTFAKKYDLIGVKIYDIRERVLPNLGLIHFKDTETGKLVLIDSTQKHVRVDYEQVWVENDQKLKQLFTSSGADILNVRTDESYILPLINVMKRRNQGNRT